MKISLKLDENHHDRHHKPPSPTLLLRAKIPLTIFNLPFISHFSTTTTHPSDLSLSLSTNFPSFPSLKLSHATTTAAAPPLTLTLKSGTGLFGSPKNSPFVISAHFSFDPSNSAHPNPTFSLFLKPQLGSFSLRKSTVSHPPPTIAAESINSDAVCDSSSFAFVPLETPAPVKEELPPQKISRASILKGTQLAAATQMPLAKRLALSFRWRVNFAEDQLPILRINKIGIKRIDDAVRADEKSEKNEAKSGELEVMKSMLFWMKREVDDLTRANQQMKSEFEELRRRSRGGDVIREGVRRSSSGGGVGSGNGSVKEGVRKKAVAPMKQWKVEESGNGGEKREEKKNGNVGIDVESELQRAIMAASAAST
ncbi:hypothetical protein SASPL_143099 [Salvia splendens]|uniref:Uncharacterized protein n=1 Tax=Salvia splendens TaxID=180675 RepID=A0A8X8WLD5_SALSN|nr:uncharacterized protein LOC121770209 [Salvia splendens]KAG6396940.1 hypothetical protein SASPL_143099 [Salvia splendens]